MGRRRRRGGSSGEGGQAATKEEISHEAAKPQRETARLVELELESGIRIFSGRLDLTATP